MAPSLTDAQLRAELDRCRSCEARPCRAGCPAGCSPADFILAARCGEPSDWRRAAALVLSHNPLGGTCGAVCPDRLCMARCSRRELDGPVNVPAIQAAIVARARRLGGVPRVEPLPATGQRVAVVGAGPAGLGAASVLAKAGHTVHVLDRARRAGGMVRLVPRDRLDPEVLDADLAWLLSLGDVRLVLGKAVPLPRDLLARGYAAVIVAAGLGEPVALDVPGRERAHAWTDVLGARPPPLRGRRVAVVGDGAVALDCAEAALAAGAAHVELFALRTLSELELGRRARDRLFASGLHLSCRVRVTGIRGRGARVTGLALRKVELPAGEAFHPSRLRDLPHGAHERRDLDAVVVAIGGRAGLRREPHPRVVYAGDLETGATSVVEALASGKRAALEVHRLLAGDDVAACPDRASCADGAGCPRRATCPEWNRPEPASGAAARPARAAARWPAPLETDDGGRAIASPLVLAAGPYTDGLAQVRRAYAAGWAGAVMRAAPDGAAGRGLEEVRRDADQLAHEFPDRWTAIELPLAVARGGDPAPVARAVDAALAGAGAVPVLFRIPEGAGEGDPVLAAVAAAIARHPGTAGVTLSDGFERAARLGLLASAADAPDHHAAARLLARGARTVQLAAVVARYGVGVVTDLHSGLSHLLAERGLRSVAELAGSALAAPAAGAAGDRTCEVDVALCTGCGSCARCPRLAISLDARSVPTVDRARCTGCGACVEQCWVGAVALRPPGAVIATR